MRRLLRLRPSPGVVVSVIALVVGLGGVAYAAIPDNNKLYTGCMLKRVGTIRLIDPSLPSGNLMGHCTSLETQVSWNQQGQPGAVGTSGPQGPKGDPGSAGVTGPQGSTGPQGAPGKNGTNGADGTSVTQADAGSNCPNGGVALTAADGTADVCNGKDGATGADGGPGKDGVSVTSTPLNPGDDAACPNGGSKFNASGGNISYACNGKDGASGAGGNGAGIATIAVAGSPSRGTLIPAPACQFVGGVKVCPPEPSIALTTGASWTRPANSVDFRGIGTVTIDFNGTQLSCHDQSNTVITPSVDLKLYIDGTQVLQATVTDSGQTLGRSFVTQTLATDLTLFPNASSPHTLTVAGESNCVGLPTAACISTTSGSRSCRLSRHPSKQRGPASSITQGPLAGGNNVALPSRDNSLFGRDAPAPAYKEIHPRRPEDREVAPC